MSFTHTVSRRRRSSRRRGDTHADQRVFLIPAGDGWSLVSRDGRTLVRGAGPAARRRCLEFASATGILAVLP